MCSERWKKCRHCGGAGKIHIRDTKEERECSQCDGTGHDGAIEGFLEIQAKDDWENELPYED